MKHEYGAIAEQLAYELKKIYNNKEFIISVLSEAPTENLQKKVLDFINEGRDVNHETVSIFAMNLNDKYYT